MTSKGNNVYSLSYISHANMSPKFRSALKPSTVSCCLWMKSELLNRTAEVLPSPTLACPHLAFHQSLLLYSQSCPGTRASSPCHSLEYAQALAFSTCTFWLLLELYSDVTSSVISFLSAFWSGLISWAPVLLCTHLPGHVSLVWGMCSHMHTPH